ncbi:hypothetical protein GGR52DRAFT_193118 [Hypoxylon sp. FL1284]|nr:hypothetical protein GGR52DRAFT_193118 [Hypoxylon sp. FL1284]
MNLAKPAVIGNTTWLHDMSRHMACKICRDRKVRCDGEPNCENCRRMGEMCVYVPSNKPTRADLAQTVEMLQDRLDRAEAYIASQCHNMQRNSMSSSHADSAHDSAVAMENPDPFLSMSGLFPNGQSRDAANAMDGFEADILHDMSGIGRGSQDEGGPLQLENLMATTAAPHRRSSPTRPREGTGQSFIPSLQEIRALNTNPLSRPGTGKSLNGNPYETEECTKILDEVSNFALSIFAAHAEMAGVASVVAEYLAWARKELNRPDSAHVLEILETRVRELHEMAEGRYRAAWQHTTSTLENVNRAAAQLNAVEREIQNRTAKISHFFDGKYDVSIPLSEQRVWDS